MRILIIFSICVFLAVHASERALGSVNRRVLHQILDNQSSELPSTESPNSGPSGFRSSPSDNSPQTPFFPTETPPPPPPPPPPPSSFNSLPANISSISIPKSSETKPRSRKLLVGGAGALAAATLFGAASAFCYYNNREQKHNIPDAKSLQFSTTLPPWPQDRRQDRRNVRATSSAAAEARSGAEFLYLGTVVNSRGPEVGVGVGVGVINNNNKLESPDLNPLPPLDRLSYPANEDDDEEEFYSPKGGGSPTETTTAIKINNGNRTNSVCSSRSSSTSCSPSQSISLTMSPPVKFSRQSSPDIFVFQTTSPPPPPPPPMLLQRSRTPPSPLFSPSPPPLVAPAMPFITKNPTKQAASSSNEGTPRRKLKALHWDKVHAKSDRETVWDQLKSSSFQLNEEMIESLFVMNSNHSLRRPPAVKHEAARVLDPKKAQNIAILLKALNVTLEEVREALREGDPEMLGTELLECLLKMSPTREEERRLEDYRDELGPAETFLKNILAVPLAFRRVQAMLYVSNFQSEIDYLNKSFHVLQVACDELRNSRMFMKLLEAVLKTGNRMNNGTTRGGAEAFKLDTLLKLVDVKGSDGKTTLLHFVVEEIARTEGGRVDPTEEKRRREIGLRVVSGISAGLSNVRKAAGMDSDVLSGELAKLPAGIRDIDEILRSNRTEPEFTERMTAFVESARGEITKIQGHERMSLSLVKEVTEYFHGDAAVEEARPFRIFTVVRDFLAVLDRVCREVALVNDRTAVTSAIFVNPTRPSPPHD